METQTSETPSLGIPFLAREREAGSYHSNPFVSVGPVRPNSLQLFNKDKNDNIKGYSIPDLYESCDDLDNSIFNMEKVSLPERYKSLLKKNRQESIPEEEEYVESPNSSDTRTSFDTDFNKDMDQAVLWIRQEVIQLKARDRCLIRKFLGLRSTLHQLRGIRSCPTLARSMASMNNVSWSLEDGSLSEPCIAPLSEKEMLMGFQNRTVSMLSVMDTSTSDTKHNPLKPRTSLDLLYLPP